MRMGRLAGAPLLALCLAAPSARSEELPTRFEAAVRAAVGIPIGNAVGETTRSPNGTSLADLVAWTVPLELELGARIGPAFVGGYLSYAFGKTGSALEGGTARSASDVRVGFEMLWHLGPDHPVDPWVGLGVGYEWLDLSITGSGGTLYGSVRGFEWVNLQLGIDFLLGRSFRLGPFVQSRVGQYDTGSLGLINAQGTDSSGTSDIPSKAVHVWIDFGLRFAFLL
ncbi:MAG TPA: hypothetical protein VMT11_16290 [Myxococcaceae bacterium]|nr:hypothetical protein [Myxococcaceae bacterium]